MSLIQKSLAMLFVLTMTFLMTSPFTPQTEADNWSDCDGNGNGYLYGFDACVSANEAAVNVCSGYYDCLNYSFLSIECFLYSIECDAAWEVASEMCRCDN